LFIHISPISQFNSMESVYMKSRFVRDQFARRFVVRALGASVVAGLALAAAAPAVAQTSVPSTTVPSTTTPAQSTATPGIYNSWGGVVPYITNDGSGGQDSWIPAFSIQAKTKNHDWFAGSGSTEALSNSYLMGLKLGQMVANPKICIQVSKPGTGWLQEQCTTGMGSQIEVGGGTDAPIEAVSLRLLECQGNDNLSANAFITFAAATDGVPGQDAITADATACGFWGGMFRCNSGGTTVSQPAVDPIPAVSGKAAWQEQDDAVPYVTSLNPFYTANTCGQRLTLGVQGGGGLPRIDALNLKIKSSDGCSSCGSQ
jgi:hypothetical protein